MYKLGLVGKGTKRSIHDQSPLTRPAIKRRGLDCIHVTRIEVVVLYSRPEPVAVAAAA
jgi:hypothetical protein